MKNCTYYIVISFGHSYSLRLLTLELLMHMHSRVIQNSRKVVVFWNEPHFSNSVEFMLTQVCKHFFQKFKYSSTELLQISTSCGKLLLFCPAYLCTDFLLFTQILLVHLLDLLALQLFVQFVLGQKCHLWYNLLGYIALLIPTVKIQ